MSKVVVGSTRSMPECRCPYCSEKIDSASGIGVEAAPRAGNVSICLYCAGLLIYNDDLQVEKPTVGELMDIQASHEWPRIAKAVEVTRQVIALRKSEEEKRT